MAVAPVSRVALRHSLRQLVPSPGSRRAFLLGRHRVPIRHDPSREPRSSRGRRTLDFLDRIVHSASVAGRRWWVFQRPLLGDRLFVLGLVIGALFMARAVVQLALDGWSGAAADLLFAVPGGLLLVGIVGGSWREYRRGVDGPSR